MTKKCIGFGEFERKCENIAGTKGSPHWCERCNKLRLEHIDKRLQECLGLFPNKSREHQDG